MYAKNTFSMTNLHKYSLGLGGGLFLSDLSVLSASPSVPSLCGSICVISVGSVGLIGCEARGASGAAPLLRDLLRRLRNIKGPRADTDIVEGGEPAATAADVEELAAGVEEEPVDVEAPCESSH